MRARTALATLGLLLAGCVEAQNEFVWKEDGSGTVAQTWTLDIRKSDEVAQMAAMLFGGGAAGPEQAPNPIAPTWLRAAAKGVEGFEIGKIEEESKEGKRITTLAGSFTTIEAAAKGGAFFASVVSLEKTETGTWRFRLADEIGLLKQRAGTGDPSAGPGMGMDYGAVLAAFEAQLSGLSLCRTIRFPAPVRETNGERDEDGSTVRWTVDYARLKEGKDLVLTVEFEGREGLELVPFSHQPDYQALLRRLVEPPPASEAPPAPATEAPATTPGG
jgi:hypothetical protein